MGNKTKKPIYAMSAEKAKAVCIIYACVRLPASAKDITHFMLDKRSSLHCKEFQFGMRCGIAQPAHLYIYSIDSYFFHYCFRKN